MSIAAIVLAAGGSRRLGRPKQLVAWGGRPLLEHVVARAATWPVDDVLVVLGAHAEAVIAGVDLGEAVVAVNAAWRDGMASSLRAGLSVCSTDRAFLVLGDQPEIDPSVPTALVAQPGPVVMPVYRGTRSNPVLVDRAVWPDVMGLTGDAGAAWLFAQHPEWVAEVAFDLDPPFDIDTVDDLRRQSERRSNS